MIEPKTTAESLLKEKRSEFLGQSFPVRTQKEFILKLKVLRKSCHSSHHICWAYRLLEGQTIIEHSSDAVEPAGTAGLPMMNQLKSMDIVNCAVFVIRYFGGEKLGKHGLESAYGQSARETLLRLTFESVTIHEKTRIISHIKY